MGNLKRNRWAFINDVCFQTVAIPLIVRQVDAFWLIFQDNKNMAQHLNVNALFFIHVSNEIHAYQRVPWIILEKYNPIMSQHFIVH